MNEEISEQDISWLVFHLDTYDSFRTHGGFLSRIVQGIRSLQSQRDAAQAECDEARRQVAELREALETALTMSPDFLLRRVGELQSENARLTEQLRDLEIELLWVTRREYSENAAECFDNRRKIARRVAKALRLSPEETELMRKAAIDHGATGGEIITWLVGYLRDCNANPG